MPIYVIPPKIPNDQLGGRVVLYTALLGFLLASLVIYVCVICLNPVSSMHEMEWLAISWLSGVIFAFILVGMFLLTRWWFQRKSAKPVNIEASLPDGSAKMKEQINPSTQDDPLEAE